MILQKMKKTAEDYLGQEVTEAVYHRSGATSRTHNVRLLKKLVQIAGLEVKRIVNRPTATLLLAYGLDKAHKDMVLYSTLVVVHSISLSLSLVVVYSKYFLLTVILIQAVMTSTR